MGIRPRRMCSRCHRTALPGQRFCAAHKNTLKERERSYAKNPLKKLFGRKAWKQTREQALFDAGHVCQHIDGNGVRCPLLATDIHHVVQADVYIAQHGGDESAFYDSDNLQALCHAHHSSVTAREVGFAGWNKSE